MTRKFVVPVGPIFHGKWVLVQTVVGDGYSGVVMWAKAELKVTLVICCDFNFNIWET